MHRSVMWVGLAILVLGQRAAAADDQEAIQGTWRVISIEQGGEKVNEVILKQIELRFIFNKEKVTFQSGNEKTEGTYKIDTNKKPRWLDITLKGRTGEGIYELDGDTLKTCAGQPGDPRPTEFSSKAGSKFGIMIMKREK